MSTYGSSPLLGQASGGWTESSSALRILNVGIRNTLGVAVEDAFTQTNPPVVTTAVRKTERLPEKGVKIGVLSGSVAFTRGSGQVGGPGSAVDPDGDSGPLSVESDAVTSVVGVFVNSALGSNPYENIPAMASGRLTYVSGFGSYANGLYETKELVSALVGAAAADVKYASGMKLYASKNGYLTSKADDAHTDSTVIGVCLVAPDSAHDELVYDQRV
jgi:hypothetical protein